MKSFNIKLTVMNSLQVLAVATACMLAIAPRTSSAVVIYNNGLPYYDPNILANGYEMSSVAQVDDFELTGPSTVNGIRFWASAFDQDLASMFSGTIGWAIHADNAGLPAAGAPLFSGSDSSVTLTLDGTNVGDPQYSLDIDVGSINLLGGTKYWLQLRDGLINSDDLDEAVETEVYWSDSGLLTGITSKRDENEVSPGTWTTNLGISSTGADRAFQLLQDEPIISNGGVPEPSTLLISALGLLGLMRKRRQK